MVFGQIADGARKAREAAMREHARRMSTGIGNLGRSAAKKAAGSLGGAVRQAPRQAPRQSQSRAPQRANSYAPPVSSTGSVGSNSNWGGSSGGGGGQSGGLSPAPKPQPVPEPPKPPSIEEWLAGDTTWMSSQDAMQKALADYQAEMERNKAQYQTEFDMNVANLGQSRESALTDLENDYAGRGLINSGLYADSTSELMSDYDARQAALESGRSNFLADILSQFQNFQSEQDLARTSARQDAINRRAQKFGL